jgi:serine/threonine protein phosphatase PrpC
MLKIGKTEDGSFEAQGPLRNHREDFKASSRRLFMLREDLKAHPEILPDWMKAARISYQDIERVCRSIEDPSSGMLHPNLEVLCDGAGGVGNGAMASEYGTLFLIFRTHDLVARKINEFPSDEAHVAGLQIQIAKDAIFETNKFVESAKGPGGKNGVSTLTMDIDTAVGHHVFWAGDSKIRHFKNGTQEWENEEHSAVAELVRRGVITPADAENHPSRSVITQYLGLNKNFNPSEKWLGKLGPKDRIVMHSDGLVLNDKEIGLLISKNSPELAALQMGYASIHPKANRDNVSVRVVSDEIRNTNTQAITSGVRIDKQGTLIPDFRGGDTAVATEISPGYTVAFYRRSLFDQQTVPVLTLPDGTLHRLSNGQRIEMPTGSFVVLKRRPLGEWTLVPIKTNRIRKN